MSNDELILEWDKLYSNKLSGLNIEQFNLFNKHVQESHNNKEITWEQCCKFAALMCYLGV